MVQMRAVAAAWRPRVSFRRHGWLGVHHHPQRARVFGALSRVSRHFPTTPDLISLDTIRARQPKELLRTDVHRTIPPHDISPGDLAELASSEVVVNPGKVLRVYRQHVKEGVEPDPAVLLRAFTQLGFLFDPNSFFSTADRQTLRSHKQFKALAHDLTKVRDRIPDEAAPVLLYAMACLEYRCAPLLPTVLEAAERHLELWRTDVLALLLHSVCSLGLGRVPGDTEPIVFDFEDGSRSRDFGGLAEQLVGVLGRRAMEADDDHAGPQDWARAAFAVVVAGLYDAPAAAMVGSDTTVPALPEFVRRACEGFGNEDDLDGSGWAQFFLYQALYCTDVEKPICEEAVKRAMPMWMQERLHHRWLNDIALLAQPQGADTMQRDVDATLRRTNTQALLNCSAGRDWDEQHCWFVGFLLEPQVSLECDSFHPMGPGRPRPSGWLALKSRILRRMGFQVATLHNCFWERLTEDQKDEQLMQLRVEVGYVHNAALEKKQQAIRRQAHVYKGIESKKKEWEPSFRAPDEQ